MIPFFSKVLNFKPVFNHGKMVITIMLYALKLGISSSFVFILSKLKQIIVYFPKNPQKPMTVS